MTRPGADQPPSAQQSGDQIMTTATHQPPPGDEPSTEYQLKKSLLLLATLVATVTYAAGLNLPGGAWLEDTPGGPVAGDPILRETHYYRYIVFYYCNATAFAASLVVSLLLLVLHEQSDHKLLRAVMVLDLFGLMGAYAAGSSRDGFTTACAAVMVFGVFAYVAAAFLMYSYYWLRRPKPPAARAQPADEREKEHEILLVLAIFAATIAYVAGLNPPGGFWRATVEGHDAGDPVLQDRHPRRYKAFYFCNTAAFVAALLVILLIVHRNKLNISGDQRLRFVELHASTILALVGLGGAYAAGGCRDPHNTAAVLGLGALVLLYIFLQMALVAIASKITLPTIGTIKDRQCCKWLSNFFTRHRPHDEILEKAREFIQLLAILAATIAYTAGLDPPGGLWSENGEGHSVGEPILFTTHPGRYKVFFYCNSAAFVASIVIVVMLQSASMLRRHVLEAAMILDLFSLIGAYAAGSCRDTSTSIYVVAVAGAVLIYVVIHIIFFTLDQSTISDAELEKYRQVLLLLAILAATLTYQAGLTPPGGFWEETDDKAGHKAGDPVLQDKFPRRYKAFFYCNAASFMSSVALIVLLVNPNMYRPGIRCYALIVCMVAGMFGLMGAYTAGSSLHLRATIFEFVLVALVFTLVVYLGVPKSKTGNSSGQELGGSAGQEADKEANMPMYLMLLGILAASVTYLTGLKPPGGLWRDDSGGHSPGSPILYDIDKLRYNAFFYSNSTSFMASIVVIAFLLLRMLLPKMNLPLWPMHTTMLLDMLALLGAYAAGSAREWETSRNVILMLIPMLAFVGLLFVWKEINCKGTQPTQIEHISA